MRTADLLDISDLVSGWCRRDSVRENSTEQITDSHEQRFANESPPLDTAAAVSAIDRVLAVYPDVRWVTAGDHGRIVCGDRLISLSMAVVDPDAESFAWLDAAGRLGNGRGWSARRV